MDDKRMEVIKKGSKDIVIPFEEQLGFSLPDDYKVFLSEYDGVRFYNCEFYVNKIQQKILIDVLYGVKGEKKFDIYTKNKRFEDEIPEKSLVIGEDQGGAPILLINDQKNNGIYFFDSNYFFENSTEEENTYLVANTFSDFFKMFDVQEILFR